MTNELWKAIKDYEDIYEVSTTGKVRSLNRKVSVGLSFRIRKGKILKYGIHSKGYLFVILQKNKVKSCKKIHRLVAETYIPNPNKYETVNHIDKDKRNNNVDNLEWCTNQYNIEYSQAKTVRLKSPSGDYVSITNISKFCRDNNIHNSNLSKVISGKRHSCSGWTL